MRNDICKLFGVFEVFCSVFLRYFDLCFRGYSYMINANLRHNRLISPNGLERLIASDFSAHENFFLKKHHKREAIDHHFPLAVNV